MVARPAPRDRCPRDCHPRIRPRGAALDIRGVSHAFRINGAPLPVLDRIDLAITPGSFVALLGPSGCGKSTLLRLAAGLDHPDAGRLDLDGAPITGPDPARLLVFQDPTLSRGAPCAETCRSASKRVA